LAVSGRTPATEDRGSGAENPGDAQAGSATTQAPADESFWDRLHDRQDGAFDLSRFLLEHHGALVVPIIITEPAVDNGFGLGVMFFNLPDQSQESKDRGEKVPPNIYGGAAVRTGNGSTAYAVGGKFHFDDDAWRYTGALGKTSLNLDYYTVTDHRIGYNLDGVFTLQEFARRIGYTPLYLTARWLYADLESRLNVQGDEQFFTPRQFDNKSSGLGTGFEYDTRDNTLTPTRGWIASGRATFFLPAIGSDDAYQSYRANTFAYFPFAERWILAARADYRATRGDAPFYVLPSIDLRGISYGRYQDQDVAMLEGELRFKAADRWTVLGFGGAGRAWGNHYDFSDSPTRTTQGLGVRYTIARALGLDVGLDYAWGPDDHTFYIQIGSAWR
jgi:outer membrane protein assembly factor BamA